MCQGSVPAPLARQTRPCHHDVGMRTAWVGVAALVGALAGCGRGGAPAAGSEDGDCYPNGTCNDGLSCLSNLCVRVVLGDGGPAGTGGPGNSAGQGGRAGGPGGTGGAVGIGGASGTGGAIAMCGNGVVEGTEICDDGGASETCAANCHIVPAITAGIGHTCTLGATGQVTCWGDNSLGQLSVGTSQRFRQVSAGGWHNCGVTLAGNAYCWGDNGSGQASPPAGRFRSVSAGVFHTCGVRDTGTIACWGMGKTGSDCNVDNQGYDCGQSAPPVGTFDFVDAGAYHTCALDSRSWVTCWGYNADGQAAGHSGMFTALSAGTLMTCGLGLAGQLTCWGASDLVGAPSGGPFQSVSVGVVHACAIESTGAIDCWGYDDFGQLDVPTLAASDRVRALVASRAHSCAIIDRAASISVICWGAGADASDCDFSQARYQCGQSLPPVNVP